MALLPQRHFLNLAFCIFTHCLHFGCHLLERGGEVGDETLGELLGGVIFLVQLTLQISELPFACSVLGVCGIELNLDVGVR